MRALRKIEKHFDDQWQLNFNGLDDALTVKVSLKERENSQREFVDCDKLIYQIELKDYRHAITLTIEYMKGL